MALAPETTSEATLKKPLLLLKNPRPPIARFSLAETAEDLARSSVEKPRERPPQPYFQGEQSGAAYEQERRENLFSGEDEGPWEDRAELRPLQQMARKWKGRRRLRRARDEDMPKLDRQAAMDWWGAVAQRARVEDMRHEREARKGHADALDRRAKSTMRLLRNPRSSYLDGLSGATVRRVPLPAFPSTGKPTRSQRRPDMVGEQGEEVERDEEMDLRPRRDGGDSVVDPARIIAVARIEEALRVLRMYDGTAAQPGPPGHSADDNLPQEDAATEPKQLCEDDFMLFEQQYREDGAARMIQRAARRRAAKLAAKSSRDARLTTEIDAAVNIQRVVRGRRSRNDTAAIRWNRDPLQDGDTGEEAGYPGSPPASTPRSSQAAALKSLPRTKRRIHARRPLRDLRADEVPFWTPFGQGGSLPDAVLLDLGKLEKNNSQAQILGEHGSTGAETTTHRIFVEDEQDLAPNSYADFEWPVDAATRNGGVEELDEIPETSGRFSQEFGTGRGGVVSEGEFGADGILTSEDDPENQLERMLNVANRIERDLGGFEADIATARQDDDQAYERLRSAANERKRKFTDHMSDIQKKWAVREEQRAAMEIQETERLQSHLDKELEHARQIMTQIETLQKQR